MHKEHVIDLATGQIAYPEAHTTPGRLAYIELYRQIGHAEWRKRFLHVYIGKSLHHTSKDILIKYGLWDEHKKLMNAYYNNRIEELKKQIAEYESDRKIVKHSDHLISDHIEELQDDIKELKRMMLR